MLIFQNVILSPMWVLTKRCWLNLLKTLRWTDILRKAQNISAYAHSSIRYIVTHVGFGKTLLVLFTKSTNMNRHFKKNLTWIPYILKTTQLEFLEYAHFVINSNIILKIFFCLKLNYRKILFVFFVPNVTTGTWFMRLAISLF